MQQKLSKTCVKEEWHWQGDDFISEDRATTSVTT